MFDRPIMFDPLGWHPVALSTDLPPGSVAGTRLSGQEVALWREADGSPHAWQDRCPHRGMRLSFGFVRGDRLACLYHGWQFDGAASCRHVPAHPDLAVPAGIRLPRYQARDHGPLLWVGPEAQAATPPACPADAVGLRSFGILASMAAIATRLGPGTPFHELPLTGGTVLVLLQPLSAEETMLHALWRGSAAGRPAAIEHLARLRRSLEAASC